MRAHGISTERSQELVRDTWLAAGEYRALVAAILGNWTSGNCIFFMTPVTRILLGKNERELHRHLWARSIKRQSDTFFREYTFLRGQKLTSGEILSVDSSGSDESCWESYTDKRAASSFLLNRLLSDLDHWRGELVDFGLDPAVVDQVTASLRALKRPQIEVGGLPPDCSFKPKPVRGSA